MRIVLPCRGDCHCIGIPGRVHGRICAVIACAGHHQGAQVPGVIHRIFQDLIAEGEKNGHSIRDLFAMLVMFNRIGRVSDQAKNICEDTLFAVTGETKQPKVYKVLFVDAHNDCASQVAEVSKFIERFTLGSDNS